MDVTFIMIPGYCSDENWSLLDDDMKKNMSFKSRADGEFWMSFRDFCHQFQEITICTLGPDFDGDGSGDKAGTWIKTMSCQFLHS